MTVDTVDTTAASRLDEKFVMLIHQQCSCFDGEQEAGGR